MLRNRLAFSLLSMLVLPALAGCAEAPDPTNSVATKRSDLPVVSICYTGRAATQAELRQMALDRCPAGTPGVTLWDHDTFFNDCPLSRKNRVTYQCQAQ